jgi:hypothetical protein
MGNPLNHVGIQVNTAWFCQGICFFATDQFYWPINTPTQTVINSLKFSLKNAHDIPPDKYLKNTIM